MTEAEFDSKALSHMLALFADAGYVRQAGAALSFPDEASRFFVNGGWLEYHLLQVLRDLQGTHPITDIAFNLKVIRPGGDTDNEIDVAAFIPGMVREAIAVLDRLRSLQVACRA